MVVDGGDVVDTVVDNVDSEERYIFQNLVQGTHLHFFVLYIL